MVRSYPPLTLRMPDTTRAKLRALATLRVLPLWRLLTLLVDEAVAALPVAERHLHARLVAAATKART